MATPKFADISKAVNDLFNDDFGFGNTKLILKSKSKNGVNFKVEGTKNAAGAVNAFLETKFTHSSGVSVKEKWTTENNVTTELSVENKVVKGSKLTAEAVFNPKSGLTDVKLKGDYAQGQLNTNVGVSGKGVLSTAGVFGFHGKYLVGASADYDTGKGAVTNNKVALSYNDGDVVVTSTITNGADVEGTVFHVPNGSTQAGLKFSWNKATSETGFELAGKYKLDSDAFVKVKADKALNIGFSYTQALKQGVSLTLAAKVNGANLAADTNQLGLSLTLEQ